VRESSCIGVLTRGSLPVLVPSHPLRNSDVERLPAYSGATVPAFHRLPAQNVEASFVRILTASLLALVWVVAGTSGVPAQREGGIVTLVPSFADDAYAIGAGGQLVAVSSYTDDSRARRLPRVADAQSVDVETIVALHPRVVIGIPAQARLVQPLRRAGVRVVLLPDDAYDSIFSDITTIGALAGREAQATAVARRLQARTVALQRRTASYRRRPSVFIVLASAPIWTAGSSSYIAALITHAGGRDAAAMIAPYGQYSAEALLAQQPDIIVADRSAQLPTLLAREPWRSLRAVELHRVYEIDSDLLERPGPRYNDAIAWFIDRLQPFATETSR
jgi:ABC-type Fe3+-hydroxamate transport system substrate-binding protein